MKYCPRCGAENPDRSVACLSCFAQLDVGASGARRTAPEKPVANRRVASESKPRVRSGGGSAVKFIVPLIVIAVLVGGGFAAYTLLLQPTPQKAVTAFFDAMSEGKYAAAAEMMTAESRSIFPIQDAASNPVADQMAQFIPKLKDLKFGDAIITENEATVEVTATAESTNPFTGNTSSTTNTDTMYLRKEDGEWKIDLARQMLEQFKKLPKDSLQKMRPFVAMGGPQAEGVLRLLDKALADK
jgi:hypothetical protein